MKVRSKSSVMSEFYCTECHNKGIPVFRTRGNQRPYQHLKKLYCIHCKKETNHTEIRPTDWEDLLIKEEVKNESSKTIL